MLSPVIERSSVVEWQRVLDRCADLFAEVAPGASIAVVARHSQGADGRRRANVMPVTDPVPMLIWVRETQGMMVREREFRGLKGLESDVLLIAAEGALEAALAHQYPLSELKRQLRNGKMLFMVTRTRDELRESGWSDFIETLGLPFLGTCR
ncbi:MAG: hypothetical protein HYX46_00735 [Betaproteobacteria bacterium]|nr:hypothetical protein [Betaproteobacteria bacterium]